MAPKKWRENFGDKKMARKFWRQKIGAGGGGWGP